jgi:hypothetical protein
MSALAISMGSSPGWAQVTLLDHFACYELKPAAFVNQVATVQDQFGSVTESVLYPHRLCNPTDKNGGGITDATDHLSGHRTKGPRFARRTNQTVVDQLGTKLLDVTRREYLMVPTSKDGVAQTPPLDHFQCYRVKRSRGTAKFVKQTVTIANQFETTTVTLTKPRMLCAPANKNNSDPTAPAHPDHLLCYKTKGTRFAQETHTLTNQFGTRSALVIARRELCIPALKNPAPPTTSTSTVPPTTTTSTTVVATTTTSTTVTTVTPTTTTSTTTTLYGSPSRAFFESIGSLLN